MRPLTDAEMVQNFQTHESLRGLKKQNKDAETVAHRFRPSGIGSVSACEHKYFLQNLLKIRRGGSPNLAAGTAVHEAAEVAAIDKIRTGNVQDLDKYVHTLEVKFAEVANEEEHERMMKDYMQTSSYQEAKGKLTAELTQQKDYAIRGIKTYIPMVLSPEGLNLTPTITEYPLDIRIDNHVFFERAGGTVDVLFIDPATNIGEVTDYKTAKQKKSENVDKLQLNKSKSYMPQQAWYIHIAELNGFTMSQEVGIHSIHKKEKDTDKEIVTLDKIIVDKEVPKTIVKQTLAKTTLFAKLMFKELWGCWPEDEELMSVKDTLRAMIEKPNKTPEEIAWYEHVACGLFLGDGTSNLCNPQFCGYHKQCPYSMYKQYL